MKPPQRAFFVSLSAWILLAFGIGNTDSNQISALVLSALQRGDIGAVSDLFHIPGSPDPSERARELRDVADLIETVSRRFGTIQSATLVDAIPEVHEIGVIGGEVPLWNLMPHEGIDTQRDYKVKFSRVGEGYLRFAFVRTVDGLRVRHILFALPTDPPKNLQIMEGIGMNVLLEMNDPSQTGGASSK